MARLPSLCRIGLRNLYQPVTSQSSKRCLPSISSASILRIETEHSSPYTNYLRNTFSSNIGATRGFASKSKYTFKRLHLVFNIVRKTHNQSLLSKRINYYNHLDDEDIASFLNDEIAAEKGNLKRAEIPKGNFEVKTDGAEVTFTKTSGNEK